MYTAKNARGAIRFHHRGTEARSFFFVNCACGAVIKVILFSVSPGLCGEWFLALRNEQYLDVGRALPTIISVYCYPQMNTDMKHVICREKCRRRKWF
jgi:hypothetical protein